MKLHLAFHFNLMKSPLLNSSQSADWFPWKRKQSLLHLFSIPDLCLSSCSLWLVGSHLPHHGTPEVHCFPKLNQNVVKPVGCYDWLFRKDFHLEPSFAYSDNFPPRPCIQVYFCIPPLSVYTLGSRKLGHTQSVAKFWPRNSTDVPEDWWKPK